jgi:hypothetical protein
LLVRAAREQRRQHPTERRPIARFSSRGDEPGHQHQDALLLGRADRNALSSGCV